MFCHHLTLDEFRNYRRLDLEMSPGVTVLQGDNASGKTSLLEAVSAVAITSPPHAPPYPAVAQTNLALSTPQHVPLVTGPPALRRRYMDVTISQMDNRYVRMLSHYLKVLAQRNSLLKSIREQGRNPASRGVAEEIAY